MNNDLISRKALKEDFDCVGFNDYDDYNRALRIINNAPTVGLIQSLTELCDEYCKNCPITDVPNECTDCICIHIRGIIKGGAV